MQTVLLVGSDHDKVLDRIFNMLTRLLASVTKLAETGPAAQSQPRSGQESWEWIVCLAYPLVVNIHDVLSDYQCQVRVHSRVSTSTHRVNEGSACLRNHVRPAGKWRVLVAHHFNV